MAVVASAVAAEETLAPQELVSWLRSADPPLVIDVRGREAYQAGTLDGALDAGLDPAGYLPDGRGGPLVLLAPPRWGDTERSRWVTRLESARHRVYLLEGDVTAWRAAGLVLISPDSSYVRPGTVPFIIPRGLCESNEPAHRYR